MTGQVPMGPPPTGPLPRTPSWAARRAGADPVDELVRRTGAAVAGAVHAEEVAALLESEGLTDEQITGRYRHPDLFSLAETLYARVPRAFPEPEPPADPWRTGLTRCVLRGLTFALPGVAYVVGGRWAGGPDGPFGVTAAVAGWAAAALVSWAWNQALAHRAGLLLLAGHPREAARSLLRGGAVGVVLATAAALAVTGTARPAPPAFALGQALYMAAATTLLVLGGERVLLLALAPLTVAAASVPAGLPSPAVASGLAATVGAAVGAAAHALRVALNGPVARRRYRLPLRAGGDAPARRGLSRSSPRPWFTRRAGRRPLPTHPSPAADPSAQGRGLRRQGGTSTQGPNTQGRGEPREQPQRTGTSPPARRGSRYRRRATEPWRARPVPEGRGPSVAMGLGGLAAGGFVVAGALGGELVAALSVSMGVAEWLLFRFRGRCLVALRGTGVGERFAGRAGWVLVQCLGGYAVALVALAGVEAAVLPGAAAWNVPHVAVLLALGCALWLALLLQSCGSPWTAAVVLSAAAATALALLAAHTGSPGAVLGLCGAGAAAVLLAAAAAVTARVTTHR